MSLPSVLVSKGSVKPFPGHQAIGPTVELQSRPRGPLALLSLGGGEYITVSTSSKYISVGMPVMLFPLQVTVTALKEYNDDKDNDDNNDDDDDDDDDDGDGDDDDDDYDDNDDALLS